MFEEGEKPEVHISGGERKGQTVGVEWTSGNVLCACVCVFAELLVWVM